MSEQEDRTEQAERAGEYVAACTELQQLIDNPEKHLPIIEYIAHLSEAKKAVRRTHKAMMAAWLA